MVNQELLQFVKQKVASGNSIKDIKSVLLANGWQEHDIDEALSEVQKINPPSPPPVTSFPEYKNTPSFKFSPKIIWGILAGVFILLLIVGGTYFFINKGGLIAISSYTEKNLLSGLLTASSKISSSSYSASTSLEMSKRDLDAQPFTTKLSNVNEIKIQYQNDSKRAKDISAILLQLRYYKGSYPTSLQSLNNQNKYPYSTSITDPTTQLPYSYAITDNGNNFSLSATLETSSAIFQIRKSYKFSDTTTIINGKTITFTKDSYSYFSLSPTPPEPFLVVFADYMSYIPPETKASASVSAQSDWGNKDSTNWKFNVDAIGDFGDLTYNFNLDALKKDSLYYFKINNIPSLFFGYIGSEKGQWIKVDPNKNSSSDSSYYGYSYLSKEFPDAEKYYKEHRQEVTDLLKKMVAIADDEKLINLKKPAYKEKVEGSELYRYDLVINKDAVVPFYKRLLEESNKTAIKSYYPSSFLTDSGYLEYLQSPEFNEVFDYYQKNTALTLWVDSQGFPVIVSYSLRIVPPDSVVQLKDKQANLVFKLVLSDINKPVNIQAPSDFKNFEDAFQSNSNFKKNKDATIKENMSTLLTNSAVYYDTNGSYNYWCSNTKYYAPIKKVIDDAYGVGSTVICKCNTTNCLSAQSWCASALLDNGDYYCVDSSGVKTESTNANICVSGFCGPLKSSKNYPVSQQNTNSTNSSSSQNQVGFQGTGTVIGVDLVGNAFTIIVSGVTKTVNLEITTKIYSKGLVNIKWADIKKSDTVRIYGSSLNNVISASIIYDDSIN